MPDSGALCNQVSKQISDCLSDGLPPPLPSHKPDTQVISPVCVVGGQSLSDIFVSESVVPSDCNVSVWLADLFVCKEYSAAVKVIFDRVRVLWLFLYQSFCMFVTHLTMYAICHLCACQLTVYVLCPCAPHLTVYLAVYRLSSLCLTVKCLSSHSGCYVTRLETWMLCIWMICSWICYCVAGCARAT